MRPMGRRGSGEGGGRKSLTPAASPLPFKHGPAGGWTLIELVITMTVMAVLATAVIPIVRTSIRRQRELRLREILREMRGAIDEFHRDTVGMQCAAGGIGVPVPPPPVTGVGTGTGTGGVPIDPRSRVYISDCTIFGVDNPERYPPSLEMLVEGVDVLPRASAAANQFGSVDTSRGGATANTAPVPKKKKYLREIPVDPMTGNAEWCLLSQYDEADSGCSGSPPSVFDVRSKSEATALNGKEKYSEW